MKSDQVIERLRALVAEAGIDPAKPTTEDIPRTWELVKELAATRVEDAAPRENDGDALLAQYGTYDLWDKGPVFILDITRQFSFDDANGEYSHMAQLQCAFHFQPSETLAALGSENLWSFGLTIDDFFDRALALPGFRHAADADAPFQLSSEYGEI